MCMLCEKYMNMKRVKILLKKDNKHEILYCIQREMLWVLIGWYRSKTSTIKAFASNDVFLHQLQQMTFLLGYSACCR